MGRISLCATLLPKIQALLDQNWTRKKIAVHLGLSYHSLQAFLQRRKIPGRPSTFADKVDETRLGEMLAAGHTHAHIAAALDVSPRAIEIRAARLGLETARTGPRSGSGHPEWKSGRAIEKHGYVRIWVPLHPRASTPTGYVLEHRLVMEVCLGRYLEAREVVHHDDDHPRHNWPSNLGLYKSNADHLRAELTGRAKATRRSLVPGAYMSNHKIAHCPSEHETLAQCSLEIRRQLAWYIESHRPTNEHRTLSRREFLRSGARRDAFRSASME